MESEHKIKILALRSNQYLCLRQTNVLLKLGKECRILTKNCHFLRINKEKPGLSKIFKADKGKLETLWLTDQLMQLVKDEPTADEALKTVTKNIQTKK
jgi:hypothetical protein